MKIVVGIDASRNRSGGAKAHLVGILTGADPREYGIGQVHVWAYQSLMDVIPDYPWLIKHSPVVLESSLVHQIWWQYRMLPKEVKNVGCDILFNTDAGSVCPFSPAVTMSQDMLSYEPGEMQRYGFSKARLRLILLKYIQSRSLRRANGAMFLTNYASSVIQKSTNSLRYSTVTNHGIGDEFRLSSTMKTEWPLDKEIRCLYISNAAMYKHQWHVVDAIGKLRQRGAKVSLLLVGGGNGLAQKKLQYAMAQVDPQGQFIEQLDFADHSRVPEFLAEADLFIFASSCENMPITLLEAMAAGLPIACSDRGPMPEVLDDGGVYFDPENPNSIADAVGEIIQNSVLRVAISQRAKKLSEQVSWSRCANETWGFLVDTYNRMDSV